jgi:hypothetical protein
VRVATAIAAATCTRKITVRRARGVLQIKA